MQFNSLAEVLNMGGYGAYVWSTILIVIVVMAGLFVHSVTAKKRTLTHIHQELLRAQKIQQAKSASKNSSS